MKYLLSLVLFVFSTLAFSDIVYQNKRYTACDTCTVGGHFTQHAKSLWVPGGPSHFVIVNTTNHSSFDSIQPGIVKKVWVRQGFNPITMEPQLNATIQTLDATDVEMYDHYIQYLIEHKDYFIHETPDKVGKELFLTTGLTWLGNNDFAEEYTTVFDNLIQQATLNPFLYAKKWVTIKVSTDDNYVVELYKPFSYVASEWFVLAATNTEYEIVDVNGNVISPLSTRATPDFCSADYCEMTCRKVFPNSGEPDPSELLQFKNKYLKPLGVCSNPDIQPSGPGELPPGKCTPLSCEGGEN